ncbi:MAG TPA: fenitrothion hydrolase [Solirubrobacterales bacterium]|nr:fenitrothion hydrolase [Solirubrobacterales bacterium]
MISLFLPLAHGLLIGRQDLPIPAWLFAWGASLVLIVSFVALSVAWRDSKLSSDRWRPVSEGLSRLVTGRPVQILTGAIGVFLLATVVYTGLEGTEEPSLNFAVTFVFVTFWLGMVVLSILLGDVFRAFNPWRAIARTTGAAFRLIAGQSHSPPLRYPEQLGRWPAVAGIVGFVWLELVYGVSGFGSLGVRPSTVAVATLAYTVYTLTAMAVFGVETWLRRGEAFSVYYGMFSQLGPLEVREGRLGIRRPLAAATHWARVPGSIALVIATIGATTFDGAQEGLLQEPISDLFHRLTDLGLAPTTALRTSESLFFALTLAGVAAVYWVGVRGMRTLRGSPALGSLGRSFAHTLIPIGVAYLAAHYFSLVVFAEQAQFTYLLSDPLGDGSDLFGTASSGIDYGLLSANLIWYVQVAALVTGHVTGLTLSHDRALTVYGDADRASKSQRWMLLVMVAFTCLGLFLLSQANA